MFFAVGSDKEHCLSKTFPSLVVSSEQCEGWPAASAAAVAVSLPYLFVGRALSAGALADRRGAGRTWRATGLAAETSAWSAAAAAAQDTKRTAGIRGKEDGREEDRTDADARARTDKVPTKSGTECMAPLTRCCRRHRRRES